MEISSSQCKKWDTSCESSDVPTSNCSLIEQQRKSYSGTVANDADNVKKIRVLNPEHEINANQEKDMSTSNPDK